MTTYDVIVSREGKWWMICIPALDGLTQARRLDEAPIMARDYIAVALDVPVSEVAVAVSVLDVDGVDVFQALENLRHEKAEADAARERVAEGTRRLAVVPRDVA